MTTFTLEWGWGETTQVSTVDELDAALDSIATNLDPDGDLDGMKVTILADGRAFGPLPVAVEIALGHPGRSSLLYLGPEGVGTGFDPALPVWGGGPVWFDANGVPVDYDADRLRLTPEAARIAAREFVASDGHRPTCVSWDEEDD